MTAEDRFCRACGAQMGAAPGSASPAAAIPVAPPETSSKAVVSLVCGLFIFAFPLSIVAIIFGHISLSEIKRSAGRLKGEGIAIAGLVLGYAGVVAGIPVILIIAAIAIPNFLRARIAANESSSVSSIRTITTAEITYAANHNGAFACSLSDLNADQLIDNVLATGQKSGYRFEITSCTPADAGVEAKYEVVARPVTASQSGRRAFCADETAVIRIDPGGSGPCAERAQPLE